MCEGEIDTLGQARGRRPSLHADGVKLRPSQRPSQGVRKHVPQILPEDEMPRREL
jgi:hypothetical protein